MNKFGKISIIAASTALPVALIVSGLVSWQLKSSNPDNVDITQGLAYLRPILVSSFIVFGVFIVLSLITGLLALKRDQDISLGKLGLVLAVTVLLLSTVAGVASNKASHSVDTYREKKEQQFFDKIN